MRRPRVWVVTPELHRGAGTERALTEQIQRWQQRFEVRVYTMAADVDADEMTIRIVHGLPGPHVLRFGWWLIANGIRRAVDQRRFGYPDAVVSPGVNCHDADAIG